MGRTKALTVATSEPWDYVTSRGREDSAAVTEDTALEMGEHLGCPGGPDLTLHREGG